MLLEMFPGSKIEAFAGECGNMINDGGFGANSGADAEAEKKAAAIAKCRSMDRTKQIDCEADWEMEVY